ncbi:tetratricopeptide repeat protein, partial [Streptomyces sp. NPDC060184]|uniref:tetratricopeptide repeat protein n=1 Tax=Streptomyces sp. NPDC060184 TaxID=3347064 RepID=UPI003665C092
MASGQDASHIAFGPNSQVNDNRRYITQTAPKDVSWPLEIGTIPALATAFQPRAGVRDQINEVRTAGSTAVLTQVLSGGGGVGKSQLAAAYATEALHNGTDLVLWVSAAEVQQVVTLYALAALRVSAPGATGDDPEHDAGAFLSWLATTGRRWLIILDDITDPAGMTGWWPASRTGTGWVLATTRLHDAALTGNGRKRIPVDVYTSTEAVAYLRARLTGDDAGHLLDGAVGDLAEALGHLPLALGHAAAYMLNQDLRVAEYLSLFNDHDRRLSQLLPETADADGYGRQIATTLLLSLDAAQRTEPVGLSRSALRIAALLDPAGHPHALWHTPAVLSYLGNHRTPGEHGTGTGKAGEPVTPEQANAALRVLHRYALVTTDRRQEPRAVRIHALTARAAREITSKAALPRLAHTVAEAMLDIWPDVDQIVPDVAATLRTNVDHLQQHASNHLWQTDGHYLLHRVGASLHDAGLTIAAIASGEQLSGTSALVLGPDHPATVTARSNLANSYAEAGRTTEATTLRESVLADQERLLGRNHPATLTARSNLAASYAAM